MLHHVLATYRYGTSVAALYAAAGGAVVGGELLAGETDAMGIDFTYHADVTKQVYISDLTTPANNYTGTPFGKLTYTSPSLKLCRQSDGVYRYVNHNLCLQSQTFNSGTWSKAQVTVTADDTTAPDGTTTADRLTGDGSNASHDVRQYGPLAFIVGINYQFSCFMKAGTETFGALASNQGSTDSGVAFNLSNGTVAGNKTGSGATVISSSITDAGGGWYRCSMVFTATSTGGTQAEVRACVLASADLDFDTPASGYIYIWGYQVKRHPVNDAAGFTYSTGYLATTTAAVYDLPFEWDISGNSLGILVEDQRTNNCLQSQTFDNASWSKSNLTATANSTTAPDGTTNADTLTAAATNTNHQAAQTLSGSPTAVAISVFAKKNTHRYVLLNVQNTGTSQNYITAVFDLDSGGTTATQTGVGSSSGAIVSTSMIAEANGWFRLILVGTLTTVTTYGNLVGLAGAATGNTLSAFGGNVWNAAGTESVYLWGAQIETAVSFASSPIHTIAAVTRAGDNVTLLTSAFPFGAAAAGTFVFAGQLKTVTSGADQYVIQLDNASINEFIALYIQNSSALAKVFIFDGGAIQDNFAVANNTAANTNFKIGLAWNTNDTALVLDGGTVAAGDGTSTIPSPTILRIQGVDDGFVNAHARAMYVRQITYLKRRATNGELQTRTT